VSPCRSVRRAGGLVQVKAKRRCYTLEFKQEVEWLVAMAAAARSLGVVEQTLGN